METVAHGDALETKELNAVRGHKSRRKTRRRRRRRRRQRLNPASGGSDNDKHVLTAYSTAVSDWLLYL